MAKLSDKYILIQCELRPTFDFQQEILSHGDEVEVLAPEHYDNVLSKVTGVKSALCPLSISILFGAGPVARIAAEGGTARIR